MLITREIDYAVRCVLEIARRGQTSTAEVAEAAGIPVSILGRIVSAASKAGILETRRGAKGGVALARDPSTITILEVIEAIEGPIDDGRCVLVGGPCGTADLCSIHEAWREARFALRAAFAGIPVVEP